MLTEKELQVLMLRQEGMLQLEIAKKLSITQGTVSKFEANARAKILEAREELAMLDRLGIKVEKQKPDEGKLRSFRRST